MMWIGLRCKVWVCYTARSRKHVIKYIISIADRWYVNIKYDIVKDINCGNIRYIIRMIV